MQPLVILLIVVLAGDHDFFYEQFCASPATACSALPVEFAAFGGEALDKVNRLTLTTAREEATAFHRVQRSADGLAWEQIGELTAAGESDGLRRYTFVDEAPLSMAFYRIFSVDVDGRHTISNIVELSRKNLSAALAINGLYPQPAGASLFLHVHTSVSTSAQVSLYYNNARRVSEQTILLNKGKNEVRLDVSALATGVYCLVLRSNNGSINIHRLIKQ